MYTLNAFEEKLCKDIVECAYLVHKQLGPGLLEKIYEACFCHELGKKKIIYERQKSIPIIYDNLEFDEGLRVDVYVEETIICELKAVEIVNPLWQAQLLSHLKLTGDHVGFVINFNVNLIKNGIRRYCVE